MDFLKRCCQVSRVGRSAIFCTFVCGMLASCGSAARIRFPSATLVNEPTILKIEPCRNLSCDQTNSGYVMRPVDEMGEYADTESAFWQKYNFTDWSPQDSMQGSESTDDTRRVTQLTTTEDIMVPVHPPMQSHEQLISENEVLSLQNQYRWIVDKSMSWKKQFGNETYNSSEVFVDAFRNKTKPIKSLSYADQKGFQNEFLDILGKGKYCVSVPDLCK